MNSHIAKRRALYLDVLRILACLGVLSFHYWGIHAGLGDACVLIFFVLSGYLSASTTPKDLSFIKFYAKKALRLLPVLAICVVFSVMLNFEHFLSCIQSHKWWHYFVHLGQFRSLLETYNVSIWFIFHYIFCILLLPILPKSSQRITLLLIIILSSVIVFNHNSVSDVPFSRSPLYVTFCVFLSGFIFRHMRFSMGKSSNSIFLVLAAGIILTIYLMSFRNEYRGLFIVLLSFVWGWIIQQLSLIQYEANAVINVVQKIAGMTYSIYLLHCPVIFSKYSYFFLPKQYQYEVSIIIVICLSYILFQYIERPITQLSRLLK